MRKNKERRWVGNTHTHTQIHTYTNMHIHAHTYTHICAHKYTYIHIYTHITSRLKDVCMLVHVHLGLIRVNIFSFSKDL